MDDETQGTIDAEDDLDAWYTAEMDVADIFADEDGPFGPIGEDTGDED